MGGSKWRCVENKKFFAKDHGQRGYPRLVFCFHGGADNYDFDDNFERMILSDKLYNRQLTLFKEYDRNWKQNYSKSKDERDREEKELFAKDKECVALENAIRKMPDIKTQIEEYKHYDYKNDPDYLAERRHFGLG